jgi:hypothetical protein
MPFLVLLLVIEIPGHVKISGYSLLKFGLIDAKEIVGLVSSLSNRIKKHFVLHQHADLDK